MGLYEEYFMQRLQTENLKKEFPQYAAVIDRIVVIMANVCSGKEETIRIRKKELYGEVVRGQYMKLEPDHIRYILRHLKDAREIRYMDAYLKTALFSAPSMILNEKGGMKNGSFA